MDTIEMQVQNFLNRCEDLTYSKAILAPSKINAILRSIAVSPALVELFQRCTKNFDYPAAQEQYILPSSEDENRAVVLLPNDRPLRIAFIFCLLSGIDNHDVNFNPFLLTCFGDGNNYENSFNDFCEKVIIPFETDVTSEIMENSSLSCRSFISPLTPFATSTPRRNRQAVIFDMLAVTKAEEDLLSKENIPEADRAAGLAILHEFSESLKEGKEQVAQALLLGYNYFVNAVSADKTNTLKLFRLTEEL